MKEYFQLQLKMTNRKWRAFGLNPFIAYALSLVGFIGFSLSLFLKIGYAQYLFIFIALSFVSQLSEPNRNDFLKSIFISKEYLKLRIIENAIIISPFIAFLAYKQLYLSILIAVIFTLLMALVNFNKTFNYTIPTLFHKKPFEFTIGFRNTFYLFIFAYFLAFMAVTVSNFNLGLFALFLVFLITFSFYLNLENGYYVWSFSDTPKVFLFKKIKIALAYSTILSAPITITLVSFFLSETYIILLLLSVAYIYLITIALAKYSAYPNEISLPQGILLGISLLFPPMLLGAMPYFYLQSVKKLNDILE